MLKDLSGMMFEALLQSGKIHTDFFCGGVVGGRQREDQSARDSVYASFFNIPA